MPTAKIDLVALAPQALRALVEGYEEFARDFGRPAAVGLRDFIVSEEVSPEFLAMLAAAPQSDPWAFFGFAVLHRADQLVIGTCGFKGAPKRVDDATEASDITKHWRGFVEIGYGIVPDYCNQGFATESVAALIDYAIADGSVNLIRAHTLPEPNASTRVLTKCDFQKVGEIIDPDDGLVWRWERNIGN